MKDATKLKITVAQDLPRACLGEGTDPDDPFGLKDVDQSPQMSVTRFVERFAFGDRQLVGGSVPARLFHEYERAVIDHEMVLEEGFR